MSVTVQQVFENALTLIDEVLPNTGTVDPAKTAEYKGRTPRLVDMIQKELLRSGDLFAIYELARSPIPNMLGHNAGFDIEEYKGEALTFEAANDKYGSVKAYYFEVDNDCTAYIEDYTGAWNTLTTVNCTPTLSGFTAYKGVVTPTPGAIKSRLRFSGTNYFRVINLAIFNYPFASGDEPVYAPWVRIDLPANVKTIDKVLVEYPEKQYKPDSMYKIEWNGTRQIIVVSYDFNGKIRVQYKPVPATITAMTDTLEIDDITAMVISYELAKNYAMADQNQFLVDQLGKKFLMLKAENSIKQPLGFAEIEDYYGFPNV